MKTLTSTLLIAMFLACSFNSFGQAFATQLNSFSHSKTSYLTLEDGSKVEGTIKRVKRKKGLINEIRLEVDGEKVDYEAKDIKRMLLPPNNLAKINAMDDFMSDSQKWGKKDDMDSQVLKEGYVVFEKAEAQIKKKKTQVLMLQLINPTFSEKIKVFGDPYARETASFAPAGITVAGGELKSYYVQKGDEVADHVKNKEYEKEIYKELYKDCPELLNKIEEDPNWSKFAEDVYFYENECK